MREFTEMLNNSPHTQSLVSTFLCCISIVVSRSKVSINNNALQSEAAGRVRERIHLPGAQEVVLIDAV